MSGTLTPSRLTSGKNKTSAVKTDHEVTVTEPVDPWADIMAAAEIAPAVTRGPRTVVMEIPETIRVTLENSLSEWNMEFPDSAGEILEKGTPKFRTINAGTVAKAKEFVAIAKTWARERRGGQVSIRAFLVTKDKQPSSVVKFAASPLVKNETRAMTAVDGASTAKVREWAKSADIEVPERGRLKPEVFAAYNTAHGAGIPGQGTIEA